MVDLWMEFVLASRYVFGKTAQDNTGLRQKIKDKSQLLVTESIDVFGGTIRILRRQQEEGESKN